MIDNDTCCGAIERQVSKQEVLVQEMRQDRCLSGSLLQACRCLTTLSMCAATFAAALNLQEGGRIHQPPLENLVILVIKERQERKKAFLGKKYKYQKTAKERSENGSNLMIGSLTQSFRAAAGGILSFLSSLDGSDRNRDSERSGRHRIHPFALYREVNNSLLLTMELEMRLQSFKIGQIFSE